MLIDIARNYCRCFEWIMLQPTMLPNIVDDPRSVLDSSTGISLNSLLFMA